MTVITAAPLARHHMPLEYSISLGSYTRRGTADEKRIPDDFGPTQSLRGFEPTYRNIIDYIVRITYRIWEDREVGYIRETYDRDSHVFDDYGLQRGAEKIVRDTTHTTAAFSDIKLIADEVIWAGDDSIGFHTSHRTIIRGTNDGDGKYGPATNKRVDLWCIANCVSRDNKIFLEHVIYNNTSLLMQLGLDLKEMAVKLGEMQSASGYGSPGTWNAMRAAARPQRPLCESSPIAGFDVDAFSRGLADRIWNRRDHAMLNSTHSTEVIFRGPTERASSGRVAYQDFVMEILTAFPNLVMQVDEVYWMGNEVEGYLTSERWSATATHSGNGLYGPATNKSVRIWGITQHKIIDRKVVEAWTMFNELELMMQIFSKRT